MQLSRPSVCRSGADRRLNADLAAELSSGRPYGREKSLGLATAPRRRRSWERQAARACLGEKSSAAAPLRALRARGPSSTANSTVAAHMAHSLSQMEKVELSKFLLGVPIFSKLDRERRNRVVELLQKEEFDEGKQCGAHAAQHSTPASRALLPQDHLQGRAGRQILRHIRGRCGHQRRVFRYHPQQRGAHHIELPHPVSPSKPRSLLLV